MKKLRKILGALLLAAALLTTVTPASCIFAEGNLVMSFDMNPLMSSGTSWTVPTNTLNFWNSIYNQGTNRYNMGNYYVHIYPNYMRKNVYYDLIIEPASAQISEITLRITGENGDVLLDASSTLHHGGPNEITATQSAPLKYGETYHFTIDLTMGSPSHPDAYGTTSYAGTFRRVSFTRIAKWSFSRTDSLETA